MRLSSREAAGSSIKGENILHIVVVIIIADKMDRILLNSNRIVRIFAKNNKVHSRTENKSKEQNNVHVLPLVTFENTFDKWLRTMAKISGIDIFDPNYKVNYVTIAFVTMQFIWFLSTFPKIFGADSNAKISNIGLMLAATQVQ